MPWRKRLSGQNAPRQLSVPLNDYQSASPLLSIVGQDYSPRRVLKEKTFPTSWDEAVPCAFVKSGDAPNASAVCYLQCIKLARPMPQYWRDSESVEAVMREDSARRLTSLSQTAPGDFLLSG